MWWLHRDGAVCSQANDVELCNLCLSSHSMWVCVSVPWTVNDGHQDSDSGLSHSEWVDTLSPNEPTTTSPHSVFICPTVCTSTTRLVTLLTTTPEHPMAFSVDRVRPVALHERAGATELNNPQGSTALYRYSLLERV